MRRRIILLSIILFFALFEPVWTGYLRVFSVKPDILLLSVVLTAAFLNFWEAVFWGMIAGFLKDIFSVYGIGINTLLFPVWSAVVVRISRKMTIDDDYALMAVAAIVVFFNGAVCRFIFSLSDRDIPFGVSLRVMLISPVYTAVLLPILRKWLNYFKCLESCRKNTGEEIF